MCLDLKDVFLATPMPLAEYMKAPLKYFPKDIVDKYNLHDIENNNYIFLKIKKGMYGLNPIIPGAVKMPKRHFLRKK